MSKLTTIQHFRSINELKEQFKTTLPKPHDWRLLLPCVVGHINGIPNSQGVGVATNGILIAILQPSGLFFGHADYFIADLDQSVIEKENKVKQQKQTKAIKPKVNIEEFV